MTLHQLKVFAAVAKLRSFTEAAETLRVSQPSVTLAVQGLGRELEVKLFEKLGNKTRLTVAGEKLLQRAEEICTKVEGIKEEMDEIKGLKKGKIRVGGSSLAAASFLPGVIQKFQKECPGIEVTLKIQKSDGLERGLLEGELDVAILGCAPCSPLIVGNPYREEKIVVIAPPNHPLTRKRSVPLELIAKEPLIIQEKSALMRNIVEQEFAEKGFLFNVRLEVSAQFGARDTIRNGVARGLGIGFISHCHVTGDIKAGRLKILRVSGLKLKRTTYVAVHKNRQISPHVQTFIDFFKRHNGYQ